MTKSLKELGVLPELKTFDIFHPCSLEQIEQLCKNSTICVTKHRESLFEFGNPAHYFCVVLSGAYKLSRPSAGGENSIVHFSAPGDVIAAFIMPQPQPVYPLNVISMGPSRALKIPRENYLESWHQMPDLIFRVQSLLSARMNALQNQKALTKAPLPSKVASFLVHLIEHQQLKNSSEQVQIPIPLTRKEIADSVGATVESVIRIMSDWSKKGLIQTNDQQITILNTKEIIRIIDSSL